METITAAAAGRHIHELRCARREWVERLQRSDYDDTEALTRLLSISAQIRSIKALFAFGTFSDEPSPDEGAARVRRSELDKEERKPVARTTAQVWNLGTAVEYPAEVAALRMSNGTVGQMYEHEGVLIVRVWKHDDQYENGGGNATTFRAHIDTNEGSEAWAESVEYAIEYPATGDSVATLTMFPNIVLRNQRAAELTAEGKPHRSVERTVLIAPWPHTPDTDGVAFPSDCA